MSVNDFRTTPTSELFTIQKGSTDKSSTFIFGNEDHTLGNALRHLIVYRPEVEFCGYSVPHPYEPKMHLRVQTGPTTTSLAALKNGLKDLEEAANLLDDQFIEALKNYQKK